MIANLNRKLRNGLGDYLGLAPALALLTIVFLVPVIYLLQLSFVSPTGAFSLEHYSRLFQTPLYLNVLTTTFKIAGLTTVICLLCGYPIAYLIATTRNRSKTILVLLVLMPFWTSVLVRSFAWLIILGRQGLLNQILINSGLTAGPLDLMYNLATVLVGMTHALMPLAILTMLAAMQNIDPNLARAAGTLGARPAHAFWRVYFPLSAPGVAAGGLLVFITAVGFFITPILLGSPKETMLAQIIVTQIDETLNWGFAGAVSMLLLAASIIVFYVFDRVIGMSALTGEQAIGHVSRKGILTQLGTRLGYSLIAAMGRICDYVGSFQDKLHGYTKAKKERRYFVRIVGTTAVLFLALPSFILVPISFSESAFFQWPPVGFSLEWYDTIFASPVWQGAMLRSTYVGLATAVASVLIGIPAAFAIARGRMAGKAVLLGFVLLPMIMPHIIVALALFYSFSKIGLVGTSFGLVLGHTIFSLPYAIVTILAVLKTYDVRLDHAAWSLGASRMVAFRRVTLPLIGSGVVTAFLFSFVKSFDELTVALFISGGAATTLPRQMWADALLNVSPTLAAASTLILLFVTVAIFAGEFLRTRQSKS